MCFSFESALFAGGGDKPGGGGVLSDDGSGGGDKPGGGGGVLGSFMESFACSFLHDLPARGRFVLSLGLFSGVVAWSEA